MAERSTDTAAVAAAAAALTASKRAQLEEEKPNPIQSFFVNILQHLPLPKAEPKPKAGEPDRVVEKKSGEVAKTTVVTFPKQEGELPCLKAEAVDADTNTHPAVLWQVYAIGGFFVLKWAWSRWNERRGKKKPSNEERSNEEPPNEDSPPPHT